MRFNTKKIRRNHKLKPYRQDVHNIKLFMLRGYRSGKFIVAKRVYIPDRNFMLFYLKDREGIFRVYGRPVEIDRKTYMLY